MADTASSSADGSEQPLRYSRQTLFKPIGQDGQRSLMTARAVLIGCGGLGTIVADILVRAGIGFLRIVDRDFVDESNLQRQVLFDSDDVAGNLPKAEAARRKLERINPLSEVEACVRDVDSTSIRAVVEDVDLILDGTDNFETRYLINDIAIQLQKPWIYAAVVGSYGMTTTIVPGETPCLRCLYEKPPAPGTVPTCDTAGVLAAIVHIIAAHEATQALRLLCRVSGGVRKEMIYSDVWSGEHKRIQTMDSRVTDCAACVKLQFDYLNAERGSMATSLCGRNAVQVSWKEDHVVDLERLAETLRASGQVSVNPYLLKFSGPDAAFTLFPDGRAIMEGTSDPKIARERYARFVG
ncbi:MAG: ThiF family adenylyltransferase [Kiritimatiellae bacterium]|nr:ThiF family adenylyltransferase [Kiritimatiellia bacterium]